MGDVLGRRPEWSGMPLGKFGRLGILGAFGPFGTPTRPSISRNTILSTCGIWGTPFIRCEKVCTCGPLDCGCKGPAGLVDSGPAFGTFETFVLLNCSSLGRQLRSCGFSVTTAFDPSGVAFELCDEFDPKGGRTRWMERASAWSIYMFMTVSLRIANVEIERTHRLL